MIWNIFVDPRIHINASYYFSKYISQQNKAAIFRTWWLSSFSYHMHKEIVTSKFVVLNKYNNKWLLVDVVFTSLTFRSFLFKLLWTKEILFIQRHISLHWTCLRMMTCIQNHMRVSKILKRGNLLSSTIMASTIGQKQLRRD